ncbi:MAG: hypothetical protein P8M78_12165 [Myxococcota bacterium]|nr:hypothetical protein [Myxococcota bacterium]
MTGELHVIGLVEGTAGATRIRKAGGYAHKGPGDLHMEHGGPEGALLLFNLYAPDGNLAKLFGPKGEVIEATTMVGMVVG